MKLSLFSVLEAVPPKTMAGFAAKIRTLDNGCSPQEAYSKLRPLRADFDSVYVDTACPLGMLYVLWQAVLDYSEDSWTDEAEALGLMIELATRLPPPTTKAGRDCLAMARDQYEDGMRDDAGTAQALGRIELIANAEA
jgi:hypothetical protein